jgi:hypothetical protein
MRFLRALGLRLFGALVLVACYSTTTHAIEATWIGGPAGSWMDGVNWSTGIFPFGTLTNVTIDDDPMASSAVTLPATAGSVVIGAVTIDTGDQLEIQSGSSLTPSFVTVDGNLVLQAASSIRPTEFLWIQPNGHLSMTDNPTQSGSVVQSTGSTGAYWNQGRISGAGAIGSGMPMFNEGFIVGDIPGETLSTLIQGNSNSNIGEMLATDGGDLSIRSSTSSATLYNAEDGVEGLIQARGADSEIMFESVTVVGGEISTAADESNIHGKVGIFLTTLKDVRLEGNIHFHGSVTLQGAIENNTMINSDVLRTNPVVRVEGTAVLTGNGRLDIGRSIIDTNSFSSNYPLLINDANHTISGAGTLATDRFRFKNRGTVEAIPSSTDHEMLIQLGTLRTAVNSGVLRATDNAILSITGASSQSIVFENFEGDDEGVIEADVNSTVRLSGSTVTVRGGVLRSIAPSELGPSMVAGKIVSNQGSPVTLREVRLEGTIGDEFSSWRITEGIENTDVFRANEILVENDVVLSGGGLLQLGQGLSSTVIRGGSIPLQFINEDNTITASGVIDALNYAFRNRGVIVAESLSHSLLIQGNTITPGPGFFNSGLLKATNGATLSLQTQVTNFEGSDKGIIHADDNSFVRVGGVNGGIFSTEGTGEIVVGLISSPAFLRDIHNQGLLRIEGLTEFAGTMRNDGTIYNGANDAVRFNGTLARLTGTGTYGPLSAPMTIAIGQTGPTMFIHGQDHTIRGRGNISVLNGGFINEGTVIAEGDGSLDIIIAEGAIMRQQGTLHALTGNSMQVRTRAVEFDNEGTITADGVVLVLQQTSQPLEVNNVTGATIGGFGGFYLEAPGTNSVTFWNQQGATISGDLDFAFTGGSLGQEKLFRNSGLISPDGDVESHGKLFITSEFVQDSTGVLEFDLGGSPGTGWFDSLSVQLADITLAGTLNVSLAGDFEPSIGDSYELLFAEQAAINGMFDTFIATPMSGKWMSLEYLPEKVLLHINAITADFDGNGYVDGDDLDDWQLASQGGTAVGDADGDGDSDGRDFLAWQRQFGAGINPTATSVAVPEPATALLLIGSCVLCLYRTDRSLLSLSRSKVSQ